MIKKRVLILGSTGMLGHMLYHFLGSVNKYEVFDISFRKKLREESVILDLKNSMELETYIRSIKPDFVVNCAGVLIKGSADDPGNAILLNSFLPHYLSSISTRYNFSLIHISTDCVFSGAKGNYHDNDFRDADDIYGRSKAMGELLNQRDITFRTSIVGPEIKLHGEGLFHWIFSQRDTVNGFTNVFWSGLTTLELARIIEAALTCFKPGLYNLAPSEKISKYNLVKLISEVFGLNLRIDPVESYPKDKSLVCSSLSFDYKIGSYSDMLVELREFMLQRGMKQYYRQYLLRSE